jgi:hypothetical protein
VLANAGYAFGKLPEGGNPDRFGMRLADRPAHPLRLVYTWLPSSGYEPASDPTMEVYRRHPAEVGWDSLDMDCCLPVRPLRKR